MRSRRSDGGAAAAGGDRRDEDDASPAARQRTAVNHAERVQTAEPPPGTLIACK